MYLPAKIGNKIET